MSNVLINDTDYSFATFYRFIPMENLHDLKTDISLIGEKHNIIGLIILAKEGINATVSGNSGDVKDFLSSLQLIPKLTNLEIKHSNACLHRRPFRRLKIKIKKEIVTMGLENINANSDAGDYIEPKDWNDIISDPEVMLVDARNVYEYRIGTFRGARDPETLNFRQFPKKMTELIKKECPKKVAMFCTGGIRCEKATAVVKKLGINEVYQLRGGILKYFEEIPRENSQWNGACFVFDGRITVNQELQARPEPLCPNCGQVMTRQNEHSEYICHQCLEYPINAAHDKTDSMV